jgi:transposase
MPEARTLPDDVESLKRLVREQQSALVTARAELLEVQLVVEKLRFELARLKRQQYGRSSEQLDAKIAQLELTLEDLEASQAARPAPVVTPVVAPAAKPVRRPLSAQLPREEIVHAAPCACPACGGELRSAGEDVAEMLEWMPAHYKVIRHVRPKFACARCERLVQSPAPSRPIARGLAGPGLLAHVLVSRYADHLPLYRQSQIFARDGIDLDRSTLADWSVARARCSSRWSAPWVAMCSRPTSCTPTTRRCRCCARDGARRARAGCGPTCAMIGRLYAVEADIRGRPPDERRRVRQTRAGPELESLHAWLHATLTTVSKKSELAVAIRYALSRWAALTRYRDDGRVEIDNNAAERSLRAIALGRKNWLFAGSDDGGERAAAIYSLLGTAQLNGLNVEAYLRHVLERLPDHPVNRVDELLPWAIAAELPSLRMAA